MSTWTIPEHAPERARAVTQSSEGTFSDAKGEALRIGKKKGEVQVGDLLLFPGTRHVGVLFEDREPRGVLDANDLLFHTCWAPPTAEPLGATGCASLPIQVLRFK